MTSCAGGLRFLEWKILNLRISVLFFFLVCISYIFVHILSAVSCTFVNRVTKMKSKVFHGMHLGRCLLHAVEIKLSGFGKYSQAMSTIVLLCCKDIHKM